MEYLKVFDYKPKKQSLILVGADQTGKTTQAITFCKLLEQGGYNNLILDHKFRYTSLDPTKVIHNLSDITGKGLQILQPHTFTSPDHMSQYFEDVSWIAHSHHKLVFTVDELHSWFADKRTHIRSFELFCRECHNQDNSFIGIFQSPSEVPNYVLRNSYHRFMLYLDLEQDLDAMKKIMGKEVKLFAENQIPQYEGLYKERSQPLKKFKVIKSD